MTSKLLLSALASVAAIVVVAARQDPSFDYPAAKHVGFDQPREDSVQTPDPLQQERSERVSVSFTDATVREVLDWLKNQGVNFVVTDQQVDKGSRVSIHVSERPISSVMEALAEAWDGRWERKGDIWVFHKGSQVSAPAIAGGLLPALPKGVPEAALPKLAPGDPRIFMQPSPMNKEQREAFEKAFQQMNDPKKWEEFQKNMDQWSKSLDRSMAGNGDRVFRYELKPGEHGFFWNGKDMKPIDEKQMKEFEEHIREMMKSRMMNEEQMKELQKHVEDLSKQGTVLRLDGEKMRRLNEEQVKAIEKQAREMSKLAPTAPGARSFTFTIPDVKPLTEAQVKELEKAGKIKVFQPGSGSVVYGKALTPKELEQFEKEHGIRVLRSGDTRVNGGAQLTSSHNLKAIYDLLTPTQIEKMHRLGYINYSDLNAKQRALLGVIPDDNWTISYRTDKVNLTIKSDR